MTKPDLMAELAEFARLDAVALDKAYYEGIDAREQRDDFAVEFLRTHHAELEAAVRDARYGRALRDAMEAEYQAAKESRRDGKQEPWITTYTLLRRLKVAADHLSDPAMHNGAREGL